METNELEILSEIPSAKVNGIYQAAKYEVKCFCGNIFVCNKYSIENGFKNKKGGTKSCGCLFKKMRETQSPALKHGAVKNNRKFYHVWHSMMARCYNDSCSAYSRYGGRGIEVCEEWHNVTIFCEWAMESGYEIGLTLDRINNNGNYEPVNCRWADTNTQASNKSNNVNIEYNGETKNLSQWARHLGISVPVLNRRINIWKLPIEESFQFYATKPYTNRKGYILNADLAVCIKNRLRFEGRKQIWVVERLNKMGVDIPNYLFSLKINGKEFFTTKEVKAINQLLGTEFK